MRPAFIVVIVVAVIMAGITGLLISNLLTPPPPVAVTQTPEAPPKPKTVSVLVAGSALEVGRTLTVDNLEWQEWPEGVLRRDQGVAMAISETEKADVIKQYEGTVLRSAMVHNEPFSEDKVLHPAGGGTLALILSPGMRSTTIAVSAISGAGGMVQPGDHVDLLLTMDLADPQAGEVNAVSRIARPRVATETILTNLKVLSRDRSLNANSAPDTPVPSAVTFEVTPQQAETIATASRIGAFSLVMRSLRNGDDPERVGIPVTTDVQVVPGLQASRRNIPLADLSRTENPFQPPADKSPPPPPTPTPVVEAPKPSAKSGAITINRWTAQQVIPTMNGKVVEGADGAQMIPMGSTAASPGTLPAVGPVTPLQVPGAKTPVPPASGNEQPRPSQAQGVPASAVMPGVASSGMPSGMTSSFPTAQPNAGR